MLSLFFCEAFNYSCRLTSGQRKRRPRCVRAIDGQLVSNSRCDQNTRPSSVTEDCNISCRLRFVMKSIWRNYNVHPHSIVVIAFYHPYEIFITHLLPSIDTYLAFLLCQMAYGRPWKMFCTLWAWVQESTCVVHAR